MSEYIPSEQTLEAIKAVDDAKAALEDQRQKLYASVAKDLKLQPDVTNAAAAEKLPFTQETVRVIARKYGVPRKRKPTVRAIKPVYRPGSGLFGDS